MRADCPPKLRMNKHSPRPGESEWPWNSILFRKARSFRKTATARAVDIRASSTRTFYCTMLIREQIEQESVDVSIWGSADGENWGTQPLLKLPQQFYRGETRAVLELTLVPEVNFIRAGWDLNRWGRVAPSAHVRSWIAPRGSSRHAAARAAQTQASATT